MKAAAHILEFPLMIELKKNEMQKSRDRNETDKKPGEKMSTTSHLVDLIYKRYEHFSKNAFVSLIAFTKSQHNTC